MNDITFTDCEWVGQENGEITITAIINDKWYETIIPVKDLIWVKAED